MFGLLLSKIGIPRLVIAGIIAALFLVVYVKGIGDGKVTNVVKKAKTTVENYEKDRNTSKKIRDTDFGAVLDLNDSMHGQYGK